MSPTGRPCGAAAGPRRLASAGYSWLPRPVARKMPNRRAATRLPNRRAAGGQRPHNEITPANWSGWLMAKRTPSCRRNRSRPGKPAAASTWYFRRPPRCSRKRAAPPAECGRRSATSRSTRAAAASASVDAMPRGRDGHVVPHAHQRHDPLQLPLVAAAAVQPYDQRISIARLIVQRSKQNVGEIQRTGRKRSRINLNGKIQIRRQKYIGGTERRVRGMWRNLLVRDDQE